MHKALGERRDGPAFEAELRQIIQQQPLLIDRPRRPEVLLAIVLVLREGGNGRGKVEWRLPQRDLEPSAVAFGT